MATLADARAVKSLNKSSGRRRFVFKTFSQRIGEINIDVYRSLDPSKVHPSEGSTFFRDSLAEYRELNTAEDFISFYEEFFPLVQSLPQIILQKDLIMSSLLSRLKMEGRLSLEPILRLIAALSRDLLGDFTPFLQQISDSLGSLLESGADKDPDIIEQIFTSWSCIMMYLQKYLIEDVDHVLRITEKLRYYPKDYVREFMAESVSFLLRERSKSSEEESWTGVMRLMMEVVEEPSEMRKSGAGVLLSHVMRITSSRLHSRTKTLLHLLVDDSFFQSSDQSVEDSRPILEVLILAFERLNAELDGVELHFIWKCLMDKIKESVTNWESVLNGNSVHLSCLLTLLISMVRNDYLRKITDCEPFVELVGLHLQPFIIPYCRMEIMDQHSVVIEKVLQLIICTIDGLYNSNNMPVLLRVSSEWKPVFEIRDRSLITFIEDLIMKHPSIVRAFGTNIIRALNNLIEISDEEVVYLMMKFCEKLGAECYSFFLAEPKELFSRIFVFSEETLRYFIEKISEAVEGSSFPIQQNRLAVLWAVIQCYPHFADAEANPSSLMEFINAIDKLLMVESKIADFPRNIWHSLVGAALRSYNKLVLRRGIAHEESAIIKFLNLARIHKLSPQVLSAVADILDSVSVSFHPSDGKHQFCLPEFVAGKLVDALDIYAENLSHSNKEIRLSTLRILCHYERISDEHLKEQHAAGNNSGIGVSETGLMSGHDNVLNLLRSVEETALSIATSRKVELLISKIEMSLSAHEITDQYLLVALNGIFGILHNRFNDLLNPALRCLTLIRRYSQTVWDRFVEYLEHCQSEFLASHDQDGGDNDSSKETGLIRCFYSDVFPTFDSAPRETVLSRLIQSLQKDPSVVESHSRQIVPLLLKFLGYDAEETTSVVSRALDRKEAEWKKVLNEWLTLFTLLPNPKAFYRGQVLKEVLRYRLLDQSDAIIQMKVLDCLLNWRDDFLVPYIENLKNLINAKSLRDELARWSLSRTSGESIEVRHRAYIIPIVIRILIPKVRNLKTLASTKNASVHHRRAVLGFLAQLDVEELPLFFWLLIEPLLPISERCYETSNFFLISSQSPKFEVDTSDILKQFTSDHINALPLEKRRGFLHVLEDLLAVFDESRLNPFLNLLMNCVVRISASCTSCLGSTVGCGSCSIKNHSSLDTEILGNGGEEDNVKERKQLRDLRSLCFSIIYLVLDKYKDHDFGGAFWDLFFISVKPLIAKQEVDSSKKRKRGDRVNEPSQLFYYLGANNKKPSPLFYCFLAMSKSYKLVPLLSREGNLVPDIVSMLEFPSASESFLSFVLKFIKNLLKLDSELDSEDISIKSVVLPHLDMLIKSLHFMFMDKEAPKRKLVKFPGKREFTLFNLLSKYVKKPSTAKTFVDILLPLLTKRHQNFDSFVDVLQTIRQVVTVQGSTCGESILDSISPLLISADLVVRNSICDVLDAVSANEPSMFILAKVLRELNATSEMEMGGLDYDKVLSAYEKVNVKFFYTIQEEHALPILAHAVHDMSSEELILRQSAFRLLLCFIEFSVEIFNGSSKPDKIWSEASILRVVNNFYLKHMGNAMHKEGAVKKVWIDLLREMVLRLPKIANLDSYMALCSDDAEQDFFNNIAHLQKHRRARALSRFCNIISSNSLSEVITYKVFVPLFFSMLFDVQDGKDEHIRRACVEALASISGCMNWNQYYALLVRCFRDLKLKPDKQKILLRLICSILDHFHFLESCSVHEAKVSASDAPDPHTADMSFSSIQKKSTTGELLVIQEFLHKKLFPKIQKLYTSDPDNINVNISLVALKLLKLLPGEIMDSQLPTIVHRISNFLKNRLESVRDEARSALSACLKELGLEYLQFIVKVLKGTLKRGYELHVLGYTLNFLLAKFLLNPICGKLDYCLDDLLSVVENDILGDVSEEKEVDKIASKMKETRKHKSYETLKLITQSVTFKTHALRLLSSVTVHLNKQISQKTKLKLESMLNHIAAGIECNPSVNQTELFIFVDWLIKDGIHDEGNEKNSVSQAGQLDREAKDVQTIQGNRLVSVDRRFSHLITAFALGVLQNYMKKLQLNREDGQLLQLLDPFVGLLGQCLNSKYENIITAALRCLSVLVRLPLPSLQSQADKIKQSLLFIAQGSVNVGSQLIESCLTLLTTLLRSTSVTLSADQLHMLIQFPLFVDFAKIPHLLPFRF